MNKWTVDFGTFEGWAKLITFALVGTYTLNTAYGILNGFAVGARGGTFPEPRNWGERIHYSGRDVGRQVGSFFAANEDPLNPSGPARGNNATQP